MTLTRREFVSIAASAAITGNRPVQAVGSEAPEKPIVELRQYTLRRAQRDTLISLFEDRFIDPQNALGAQILGTFRDHDDPDRFVWLRGFSDMSVRQHSLESFYGGPVWHASREAANATIADSDNVLLLRPAADGYGFNTPRTSQSSVDIIGARIHYLGTTDPGAFARFFDQAVLPRLLDMKVQPIARLITHPGPNNFRLPIREHDRVYVWFARWKSIDQEDAFAEHWSSISGWRDDAPESVLPALMRKPERLRLSPTTKSELR